MHARIAVYKFTPGGADVVIERARSGMLAIFRRQPGFRAYSAVKTADDAGVSISTWDSPDAAEAAVREAAQWVRDNVAALVLSVENHVGEVAFLERQQS